MYFFDKKLKRPVRVEPPDPLFARQLQQATAVALNLENAPLPLREGDCSDVYANGNGWR